MTKLRKGEDVSMEAPRKNCVCLGCNIGDIVKFVDESKQKSILWDIQYDMIIMSLGAWETGSDGEANGRIKWYRCALSLKPSILGKGAFNYG